MNGRGSGDNLSTEIFELPPKRPKHTKLEKLDNKSTVKLQRQGSKIFKDDILGQKRAKDDIRRVADLI